MWLKKKEKIMEGEYIFTVVSVSLGKTWEVDANHPDEVWGELFPNDYPPDDCEIVDSKRNPRYMQNKECLF